MTDYATYRAGKCKACGVKLGQGTCPRCVETIRELREAVAAMKAELLKQAAKRKEQTNGKIGD